MRTVESCPEGYKLAAPAFDINWGGGGGAVVYNQGQQPPADVTYDHKRYNYIQPEPDNGHVCIKETSKGSKGHE